MTAQAVINHVCSQKPAISRIQAESYIQFVHRFLLERYILATESFQIAVTESTPGTYEYALDVDIKRIRTVNFMWSANSFVNLTAGSTKDWDVQEPTWRLRPNATPREFSVEEGKLTVMPAPPRTSVGVGTNMYPRLEVTAAVKSTLDLTDSLPWDVPENVYMAGIKYYWAVDNATTPQERQDATDVWKFEIANFNAVLPKASHNYRPQSEPEFHGVDPV